MSIASEITRLQTAKEDIKFSIENKGVTVPSNASIDTYYDYIDQIEIGGGGPAFDTSGKVENLYVSSASGSSGTKYQVTMSNGPEFKIKWARIYDLSNGTYEELTDGTYTAYYYRVSSYLDVGAFIISENGTKIKITRYDETYNVNSWSCVTNSGVNNPSKLRIVIAVDTPNFIGLKSDAQYTQYYNTGNSRTSSGTKSQSSTSSPARGKIGETEYIVYQCKGGSSTYCSVYYQLSV